MIKFFTLFFFLMYLYNTVLTMFAIGYKEKKIKKKEDINKFLILIPCHNEQEVIFNTLFKLHKIKYNKDKYLIVPILDNCSDNTKEQVELFIKNSKATNCMPLEVNGGSKPKALNAAIFKLKEKEIWFQYDSIMILDADNVIDSNMLSIFNSLILDGHNILQSRILSHNDSSTVAKGFTSSFNYMTYGFQIARNKINLSGTLCGTGFAIKRTVWDEVDFMNCSSLTEDLEFSILSILQGYKIKFVPETYVLNQNLDEFKPSVIQRIRWCRGHMQVCVSCILKLLIAFIKKPSLQLIDSMMFLITPGKSVVFVLINILSIITHSSYISLRVLLILNMYNLIFVYYVNNRNKKYFIPHILYSISMHFIIVIGAITYKKTHWVKTTHKKIETSI